MTVNKKHILIWALFSLILAGQPAYSQYRRYRHSLINWGFRVGFNALSNDYYNAHWGNTDLEDETCTNMVGFNISGFARINLKRIFWQPEISWNLYNQSLSFSLLPDNNNTHSLLTNISIKTYTGNANALIGYDIVKEGPFICSLFAGPSFKYIYKSNYNITNYGDYSNLEAHFKYTGILGVSVHILKTCFDIRYEINRPDTDIHLNEIPNTPEALNNVYIHKNENILSFSFGFMF